MGVRAVTLDASGTLIIVAEPVGVTYARFAAAQGIIISPADVDVRFRRAFAAASPLAFPGRPAARCHEDERAWWQALVRAALGDPDVGPPFQACFAALYAHYGAPGAWRVFPEVPEALARLRQRGLRLAVVSNFDSRLPPLLAGLGLTPLLDVVIHSSAVGHAKPDPAILHAAARALHVHPTELLHVGDAPEDVAAAEAAGAGVVRLTREHGHTLTDVLAHPALGPDQP